ncbi:hypothetical protein VEE56_45210 (plasmid) [Escherichia coli]|nr:hypothetical protein VEE56_45210 [Escherichia coli]
MRKPHSPFLASIYEQMLMLRYAMATVEAYLHWIKAFIRFSRMKHPVELGEAEVQQFCPIWSPSAMWLSRLRPRR